MNFPNSALAYFTPAASKPRIHRHRIHAGKYGTSSTTSSNDLVKWFKDGAEAVAYYRNLGWRVWKSPCCKYGESWLAFKVNK